MKKMLRIFLFATLPMLFFAFGVSAQVSFVTGQMGVELDDFGQIEIFASTLDTIQIDRASLLFGTGSTTVFDFTKDAESVKAAELVAAPALSDFELNVWCDNSYSGNPPNILEKLFVYGWNNAGFTLQRIRVTNLDAASVTGVPGLELLPQVDAAYGDEKVEFLPAENVIDIYKEPGTHVGFKLLSHNLKTFRAFPWYGGYNDFDDSLWTWLNYNQIDSTLDPGADGAVGIVGMESATLAAGDSLEFFFAFAVGKTRAEMLANMAQAEQKYQQSFTGIVEKRPLVSESFALEQNYPNPFNPSTRINFRITKNVPAKLVIYNVLGEQVATLLDKKLTPGEYVYEFNATDLPGGVYYYQLTAGDFRQVRKMTLVK